MSKKIIIFLYFCFLVSIYSQDLTIFFLKDGSILQGKIVNENQNRIFLKTDQGTIKISPADILGREDSANKGDLTYLSDRLDQLNVNVRYISGKVNHLGDSLRFSFIELNELIQDIEAIQNEFEIELLSLQSKTRQHKQNLDYNKDDLTNNRVRIAENNQKIGGISDTLIALNNLTKKINEKLDTNVDKAYLLSGNLSTIKKDIEKQSILQAKSQNQIDMMAGALANNIQEVIRVQGQFGDVQNNIEENSSSINEINRAIVIQKEDLVLLLNKRYNSLNEELLKLNENVKNTDKTIISIDQKSEKERRNITNHLDDLKIELDILDEKYLSISRQNKLTEEKLNLLSENIDAINKKLIRMESSGKKVSNQISEIESRLDSITKSKD